MTDNPGHFAAVVAHLYPGAVLESAQALAGGVSADVHRLDLRLLDDSRLSVVLRAHRPGHSGHSAEVEYELLQALRQGGVPVPEPLYSDTGGQLLAAPFLVMTFIQGTSQVPAGRERQYIERMATQLRGIHALPVHNLPALPPRRDPLPEVFDYLPSGSEWTALRTFLQTLSGTGYQGVARLLHGDFWPENLLWQGDRIGAVLDWEDAALGDPLSDVAACCVELRYRYGRASMEQFTRAYSVDQPLDRRRLALWQVYVAAAAQQFMGDWGLPRAQEAQMRQEALASLREAGAFLMTVD